MSDVLIYNAIKENTRLQTLYNSLSYVATDPVAASVFTSNLSGAILPTSTTGLPGGSTAGDPSTYWCKIPQMTGATGSVKVCDASGYYRCGASCTWTVPAGVTCAQFQLWGPGGGTGTNCCCGGAPFGPTGAYASVIMPVTAGNVYTLCAGCAQCCYASQTTPGMCGGPSYVTGTGLTGFCAESGISCHAYWVSSLGVAMTGTGQFPASATGLDQCGPENCSGWNFCWDTAADNVDVPYSYSTFTKFYGTATGGTVYGIAGMYPKFCIGSDMNTGSTTAAPIFGYELQSKCTYVFNGNTCAGCTSSFLFGTGKMPIPGQGGYASSVYAGCNACYGDAGRMGMVCVRYK